MSEDYKVGYGRPPKASRFRPGQSGNKWGRPRRPKPEINRTEIFRRVAHEIIEVQTEFGLLRMNRCEALIRQLTAMSLNGNHAASKLLQRFRKLFPASQAQPSTKVFYISEADARL